MRPRLLRPPVRLTGTSRLFSGSFLVSSEKSAICMKRWPGVRGFSCMTAISFLSNSSTYRRTFVLEPFEEFDLVAFFQSYVSLFPIALAALAYALFPFLTHEVRGADLDHGHFEQMLDGLANLVLARTGAHSKQHLASLFVGQGALLGDDRRENQALRTTHLIPPQSGPLPASLDQIGLRSPWQSNSSSRVPDN